MAEEWKRCTQREKKKTEKIEKKRGQGGHTSNVKNCLLKYEARGMTAAYSSYTLPFFL